MTIFDLVRLALHIKMKYLAIYVFDQKVRMEIQQLIYDTHEHHKLLYSIDRRYY